MKNPYSAYGGHQQVNENVRETEARALISCASRLEAAQKVGTTYNEYCDAIRHNQQLWTIFQAALLEEDNDLPVDLKDTLKALSLYVDKRSLRCIGNHLPQLLDILITINRQIAAGLMGNAGDGKSFDITSQQPQQQQQQPAQAQPPIGFQRSF